VYKRQVHPIVVRAGRNRQQRRIIFISISGVVESELSAFIHGVIPNARVLQRAEGSHDAQCRGAGGPSLRLKNAYGAGPADVLRPAYDEPDAPSVVSRVGRDADGIRRFWGGEAPRAVVAVQVGRQ